MEILSTGKWRVIENNNKNKKEYSLIYVSDTHIVDLYREWDWMESI